MFAINKLSKQRRANEVMEEIPNINRTILDAFRRHASSQLIMTERFEEEIFLHDGRIVSIDDLIVAAAILGSLLSTEGRVIIGIHNNGSATYLEIDTTKLRDASDARTFINDLRQTAELSRNNVMVLADIEVTDGNINQSEDSTICLLLQDGRCMLSVRRDSIEQDMFAHLCKVTTFACERTFNHKAVAMVDALPTHPKYELYQRKSMVERIFNHKQKKPSDLAIVDTTSGQTLTYADLWNASESLVQQVSE